MIKLEGLDVFKLCLMDGGFDDNNFAAYDDVASRTSNQTWHKMRGATVPSLIGFTRIINKMESALKGNLRLGAEAK